MCSQGVSCIVLVLFGLCLGLGASSAAKDLTEVSATRCSEKGCSEDVPKLVERSDDQGKEADLGDDEAADESGRSHSSRVPFLRFPIYPGVSVEVAEDSEMDSLVDIDVQSITVDEGRTGRRKRKKKGAAVLLFSILFQAGIVQYLIKGIAFIVFKALIVGKIALVLASLLVLRQYTSGNVGGNFIRRGDAVEHPLPPILTYKRPMME